MLQSTQPDCAAPFNGASMSGISTLGALVHTLNSRALRACQCVHDSESDSDTSMVGRVYYSHQRCHTGTALAAVLRVTSYELAKSGPPFPFVGAFGETRETGKQETAGPPGAFDEIRKARRGFGRKKVRARLRFDSLVSFWAYLNALVLDMRSTARRSY